MVHFGLWSILDKFCPVLKTSDFRFSTVANAKRVEIMDSTAQDIAGLARLQKPVYEICFY